MLNIMIKNYNTYLVCNSYVNIKKQFKCLRPFSIDYIIINQRKYKLHSK